MDTLPVVTDPTDQARPRRLTTRTAVIVLATAAALAAAAFFAPKAISALTGSPETFEISGDLTLTGYGLKYGTSSGDCLGDGGYSDIHGGLNVVVTDSKGETVAMGALSNEGKARRDSVSPIRPTSCTFTFTIADVPEGSKFYGITLGRRGTQQFARDDLNQPVHLTLP